MIQNHVKGIIEIVIYLMILDVILEAWGGEFGGVNLTGMIVFVVTILLLIAGYQSDIKTVQWIKKLFRRGY